MPNNVKDNISEIFLKLYHTIGKSHDLISLKKIIIYI